MPRPPSCDGPDCEPSPAGWLHYPDCATQYTGPDPRPDTAAQTALEDGAWRRTPTATTPVRRAA